MRRTTTRAVCKTPAGRRSGWNPPLQKPLKYARVCSMEGRLPRRPQGFCKWLTILYVSLVVFTITGLAGSDIPAKADKSDPVADFLSSTLSLSLDSVPLDSFDFVLQSPKVSLKIDPDLFPSFQSPSCSINVTDLKVKYILSWFIHFSGGRGKLSKDGILVTTAAKLKKSDPVFECYKETKGEWLAPLLKTLETSMVSINLHEIGVVDVIRMLNKLTGLNTIVEPELVSFDSPFYKEVSVNMLDVPVEKPLEFVLNKRDMTYRLQGGVVLITKKPEKATK